MNLSYKESTGFEPAHQYKSARRISSPVHYHSANSPKHKFKYNKINKLWEAIILSIDVVVSKSALSELVKLIMLSRLL